MPDTISLCVLAKNEAQCIEYMLTSVLKSVNEVVLIDTGSSDHTTTIARNTCNLYNIPIRIYKVGFSDFGSIRTLACHMARCDWVLTLDCDEWLTEQDARVLPTLPALGKNALAFPRKRWLDLAMTQQTEKEAYPDLQVRFFRNNPAYVFRREVHEYFDGAEVTRVSNPIIQHFHDVFHTKERLVERAALYTRLAAVAGVTVEGGKPIK